MSVDLTKIPLAPNPNGDPPNFEGGETLQPTILATGITFIVISVLFVILRLYTNHRVTRKLNPDDYFCLIGEIAGISYWFIFYEIQVKAGVAKHGWDVPASVITPRFMKSQTAIQIITAIAHACVKSSILLFYVRIFGSVRWILITCYALVVAVFVLYGAYMISLLVFCIPAPGHEWDTTLLDRCAKTAPITIAMATCAMLFDVAGFILPFFIITGLTVQNGRKVGLMILFLVGFLVVVTSVAGLAYRVTLEVGNEDTIWTATNVSITAYTEIFGTVIVSSAPALSAFWSRIFSQSRLYSSLVSGLKYSGRSKQSVSNLPGSEQDSRAANGHSHSLERFKTQSAGSKEVVEQQAVYDLEKGTDTGRRDTNV